MGLTALVSDYANLSVQSVNWGTQGLGKTLLTALNHEDLLIAKGQNRFLKICKPLSQT